MRSGNASLSMSARLMAAKKLNSLRDHVRLARLIGDIVMGQVQDEAEDSRHLELCKNYRE